MASNAVDLTSDDPAEIAVPDGHSLADLEQQLQHIDEELLDVCV